MPGSDAGMLFMHNDGFSPMSAHGIIATTAIALERGLLMPRDRAAIVYDTVAGTICARDGLAPGPESRRVSFVNTPSFVLAGGVPLQVGNRVIRADLAFGGGFYAIVDSEAAGVAIDLAHIAELRRVGMEVQRAVDGRRVRHPLESGLTGIDGAVFTGPANDSAADLRSVTVFADAAIDRSPCGTAMSAVMAVLSAMNLLEEGRTFVGESLLGTSLAGRIDRRTTVGEYDAIVPEIEGVAWLTGDHSLLVADDDPLGEGVLV